MPVTPHILAMSDGAPIAVYDERRSGLPVVLFSNSLGTDWRMWDSQVAAIDGRFGVVRYDTRGHGRSGHGTSSVSIERLAQDVIDILDALELDQVHFCGLSLGGMTGQWLGRSAPGRLTSLVLAATSAYMGPPDGWQARIDLIRASGMAAIAERTAGVWFTGAFRTSHPAQVKVMLDRLLASDVEGYAACCAAIRDMDQRGGAADIAVPTMVISGADDPATPPPHGQFIADAVPSARLSILPGAHLLNMATPEFSAQLLAFLVAEEKG